MKFRWTSFLTVSRNELKNCVSAVKICGILLSKNKTEDGDFSVLRNLHFGITAGGHKKHFYKQQHNHRSENQDVDYDTRNAQYFSDADCF